MHRISDFCVIKTKNTIIRINRTIPVPTAPRAGHSHPQIEPPTTPPPFFPAALASYSFAALSKL